MNMPYLDSSGDVVIPFNSPAKYHWWKEGGQSVQATREELNDKKWDDAITNTAAEQWEKLEKQFDEDIADGTTAFELELL